MSTTIYLEGGGQGDLEIRCREGFRKLLERCGYRRPHLPKLMACGGRGAAFDAFQTALANVRRGDRVFLWIDSEDPMANIEATWEHLQTRDHWNKPNGATNEQVLLMTTCMETWIVADRETLVEHYGADLQVSALPALNNLEDRARDAIQDALMHASRNCGNAYKKGKRSFEVLGKLNPATLSQHLPSFRRVRRILNNSL